MPGTRLPPVRATTSRWVVALALLAVAACSQRAADEIPPGPTERAEFPDFSLENLRNRDERLTLAEVAGGRPAVVNFFASWCAPCKRELPLLVAAFEEHGDDVAFLGVDTEDSASEGLEMLDRYGIEYPAVYDPDARIRNALGRSGLPVTVFVTSEGAIAKIVAREVNANELDDEIEALVDNS